MAITFVNAGTSAGANYAAVTPGLPASIQADDLLVCFAFILNKDATLAIDQSWSTYGNFAHGSSAARMYVFWKVATASESGPTVTPSGGFSGNEVIAQIAAFRGTSTTDPWGNAAAGTASASTSPNIGPITGLTPTTANSVVLVLGAKCDDFPSTVDTLSGDSQTWVEIGEPDSIAGNDAGIVWDYAITSGTPEITAKTFTVNSGAWVSWIGRTLTIKPATGAQTLYISVAGTLTSSGIPTRQISRNLAGAITFSGSLLRQMERSLNGTLVSAGAIVRRIGLNRTGVLDSAGSVLRQVQLQRAGMISSSGSLAKRLSRSLSGTLALTGSLVRRLALSVAGVLTSSGSISVKRVLVVLLAGTMASSGVIEKVLVRNLASTLTSAGALTKGLSLRSLAGGISSVGAFTKVIRQTLAGVLSSLGNLVAEIVQGNRTGTLGLTDAKSATLVLSDAKSATLVLSDAASAVLALSGAASAVLALGDSTAAALVLSDAGE